MNYTLVVGVADGPLGETDISPQKGIHTAVMKGF